MLLIEYRRFYVYAYLDIRKPGIFTYSDVIFDYEPFYIGKGTGDRCYYHLNEALYSKEISKSYKCNKILKIIRDCKDTPKIVKIMDYLTNEESLESERVLVDRIGRLNIGTGPLVNKIPGGSTENGSGQQYVRDMISKSLEGTVKSEESKKRLSNSLKNSEYAKEQRSKLTNFRYNNPAPNRIKRLKLKEYLLSIKDSVVLTKGLANEFTYSNYSRFCLSVKSILTEVDFNYELVNNNSELEFVRI